MLGLKNKNKIFVLIVLVGIVSLVSINALAGQIPDMTIKVNNTSYTINNREEISVTYTVEMQNLDQISFEDKDAEKQNSTKWLSNATLSLNLPNEIQVNDITWTQNGNSENVPFDKENLNLIKLPSIRYDSEGGWIWRYNSGSSYWNRSLKANPFEITIKYTGNNLSSEAIKEYTLKGAINIEDRKAKDLPNITLSVDKGVSVNISVSDSRGNIGNPYNTANDTTNEFCYEDLSVNNTLIGRGLANFKVSGIAKDKDSDYYLSYRFIKKGGDNNLPWKEILLNTDVINADIDYENPNNLTFRSYDVNHLPTLSGNSQWSDPNLVFKNPSSDIKDLPTTVAKSKAQYGELQSYVDSNGIKKYKWVPNMVFYDNMLIGGEYKEASKYWGYIKPKKTGWYKLGILSDDGAKGTITANGKAYEFSKKGFYPHGTLYFSNNDANPIYLSSDQYYPISLEYFNWGGNGSFKIGYQYSSNNNGRYSVRKYMGEDGDAFTFYPSKSKEPGENAEGIFTGGKDGIPFPSEEGSYYIEYKILSKSKNNTDNQTVLKEGKYGYFNVENRFITTIGLDSSENLIQGKQYDLKYILIPKPISTKDMSDVSKEKLSDTVVLTNISINGMLPPGIKFITKGNSNLNENSSNEYSIEKSGFETPTGTNFQIKFSGNLIYKLDKKDMMYKSETIEIPVKIQIVRSGEFIFNGNDNRITYEYSGKDMALITQYFPTTNINALSSSKIIEMGILDSAIKPSNIGNVNNITDIVNKIPAKVALSVQVNLPNTIIDISLNQNYLELVNGNTNISINKYNIINGNVDFTKVQSMDASLSDNKIKIGNSDKFTLQENNTYLLVINIIPNIPEGEQLNISGSIEGYSDTNKHYAILQPTEMPDVF